VLKPVLERRLILASLTVAALQAVLFWGHRAPGLSLLAGLITWAQQLLPDAGGDWFLRCYFLLPCVMVVALIFRQLRYFRDIHWLNTALLAVNAVLAAHAWICLMVLTRG